jgi:HSP20 family protein
MAKQVIPWKKGGTLKQGEHPLSTFQRAMNQLFDDFFTSFDLAPFSVFEDVGRFRPSIDMAEDEKQIIVTAELPGMDEKDIEITLSKDALTIKGEKQEEKDEKDKESYYMERSFGSFQRVIPIPKEVNVEKVEASFKKGVLSITMPKVKEEKVSRKKIQIKGE